MNQRKERLIRELFDQLSDRHKVSAERLVSVRTGERTNVVTKILSLRMCEHRIARQEVSQEPSIGECTGGRSPGEKHLGIGNGREIVPILRPQNSIESHSCLPNDTAVQRRVGGSEATDPPVRLQRRVRRVFDH